jgi:hypothetical protein
VADDPAAGVRGTLLQYRRDVERRRLEVRLTAANAGLRVDAVALRAPGLPTSPGAPGGAELPRSGGLDLPVVMTDADCAVAPGAPVAEVGLRDDTGATRTVSVPLDDGGLVARLHEGECADQALRAQADVAVSRVEEEPTPHGPGLRVTVTLTRRSGADPVRVTDTGSNTVYDISAAGPLPTLTGAGPATLELDMVPARCDVHALGESYRTGLIGLVVALGDRAPRPFVLVPADDVRRRLESFAVRTCRGTGG